MKPYSNSIPVLGIPHYNRADLTRRCLLSIDHWVDQVVLVNNSYDPALPAVVMEFYQQPRCPTRSVFIVGHPNAGVAGAWNEIIKLFPADWWLIANNDIAFTPGDLAAFVEAAQPGEGPPPPGMIYGNHGASCFAITRRCVDRVGLFDENIYPAYLEDCDYAYRLKLLQEPARTLEKVYLLHGETSDFRETQKGSNTIHSNTELNRRNGITHAANFEYYRAKWGGDNGREVFTHPFNDPQHPVWAWRFDVNQRRQQKIQF